MTIDSLPDRPLLMDEWIRSFSRNQRIEWTVYRFTTGDHCHTQPEYVAQFLVQIDPETPVHALHFDPFAVIWESIDSIDRRASITATVTTLDDALEAARGDDRRYGEACLVRTGSLARQECSFVDAEAL